MKSKKGDASTVAIFIIALIAIFTLSYLLFFANQNSDISSNKQIINSWINSPLFLVERQLPGGDIYFETGRPPIPFLYTEPITLDSQTQVSIQKNKQVSEASKFIAEAMLDCKQAFGSEDFLYSIEKKVFCYPCAIISIDSSLQGTQLNDLHHYLETKKVKSGKNQPTFIEAITDGAQSKVTGTPPTLNEDLYLYFVATKGLTKFELLSTAAENIATSSFISSLLWIPASGSFELAAAGTATEVLQGEEGNFQSTIFLGNKDLIQEVCKTGEIENFLI